MKNLIYYVSVLCFILSANPAHSSPEQDSLALVAIYNTNINNTLGWDLNQPISSWSRVHLNGDGCVDSLVFNNSDLYALPIEIGNLDNLPYLI